MTDCPVNLGAVAERLNRIELENQRLAAQGKRMRVLLALFITVGGAGLLSSFLTANEAGGAVQTAPRIVRASAFMIVDRNGNERGSFGYNDAEQGAYLNLESDKSGLVSLSMSQETVGLRLTRGKNDINLGCSSKGGTYLEMFDKDGKAIFEQRRP
jgi:hypothetical protein